MSPWIFAATILCENCRVRLWHKLNHGRAGCRAILTHHRIGVSSDKLSHLPAVQHAMPARHKCSVFATTSKLLLYSTCRSTSCTGEHTCMHHICMHHSYVHHITAAAACMRCLCRGCAAFGVTTICRLAVSGCEDGLPVVALSFVSVGGG